MNFIKLVALSFVLAACMPANFTGRKSKVYMIHDKSHGRYEVSEADWVGDIMQKKGAYFTHAEHKIRVINLKTGKVKIIENKWTTGAHGYLTLYEGRRCVELVLDERGNVEVKRK